MAELKLPKLPDRTPVKLTITLGAELHQTLKEYADLYQATYNVSEQVVDLIPFMLEAFVQGDKGFCRGGRKGQGG
jgi:hypothetical protein